MGHTKTVYNFGLEYRILCPKAKKKENTTGHQHLHSSNKCTAKAVKWQVILLFSIQHKQKDKRRAKFHYIPTLPDFCHTWYNWPRLQTKQM